MVRRLWYAKQASCQPTYDFRYRGKAIEVSHDPGEFDTTVLVMSVGHP